MDIYTSVLQNNHEFIRLKKSMEEGVKTLLATGTQEGQRAHLIYSLTEGMGCSLVICSSELKAKEMAADLACFLKSRVCLYPSKDIIFYSADVKSVDIVKTRFEIIDRLLRGEELTVVLSVEALFDHLVKPEIFKDFIINIESGDSINLLDLQQKLVLMGYERCDLVEGQGQFAVRGGIMDIFPPVSENAVRMEFWGDEVDSLKSMDVNSQRSIENIRKITLYPMGELVYNKEDIPKAIENIKAELKSIRRPTDRLKEVVSEICERLMEEMSFPGVDKLFTYFYPEGGCLLDYIPENAPIFIEEPSRVREHSDFVINEFSQSIKSRIESGNMLPGQMKMALNYDDIIHAMENRQKLLLTSLIQTIRDFSPKELIDFKVKSSGVFKNNMDALCEDLKYMCNMGYKVIFMGGGSARCERLEKELSQRDIRVAFMEKDNFTPVEGMVYIMRGTLLHGFEYPEERLAFITDNELSAGTAKAKRRKSKKEKGAVINSFSELKPGDYVVHESYGVCIFKGVEQIYNDGVNKDYIKLSFQGEDVLYVAINQLDILQKYIGGESAKPKLNKLGGTQWKKAKAKARGAAMAMAEELVKLYAQRQSAKGHIFDKDTVWQREFEEAFPYTETDDQLTAIEDVKADMEQGRVMDRLICGDVGFGKTEVALRAAFKTVQEGMQVAYLVPTTILARQHYQTFASRMEEYPLKVDMLSRFRTPKQQKETIKGLENGSVDVVIGTHRLLSKDISFKNLGLVIVDEEQRFGVAHKEKLKALKQNVNVLTLTATPIPRTLHMSLTGIRDMSVLEEPPSDRLPVQTYVMEYEPQFVKDAIHRELARGGQVFFLFNRVEGIELMTAKIEALVPEATVAFAHGQMSERELESVMMDFMDREIDVLVCTTIIETGLDMPNVNTIIIYDADKMGLSQLYQLRGRVGRSTRSGFAYLMYQRDKVLTEVAAKRLKTIREFTRFGSGFRIALKDLEIRGAGSLLGAEQHGHMDSVGYELYCKLLDEAVRMLKGEKVVEAFETLMEITVNAFIPDTYIEQEEQKLDMYKKISLINSREEFLEVQDELCDRYGEIPKSVSNLLDIAYVKALFHKIGAVKLSQKKEGKVIVYFGENTDLDPQVFMNTMKLYRGGLSYTNVKDRGVLTLSLKDKNAVLKELEALGEELVKKQA